MMLELVMKNKVATGMIVALVIAIVLAIIGAWVPALAGVGGILATISIGYLIGVVFGARIEKDGQPFVFGPAAAKADVVATPTVIAAPVATVTAQPTAAATAAPV
jgi:hypothetical protein